MSSQALACACDLILLGIGPTSAQTSYYEPDLPHQYPIKPPPADQSVVQQHQLHLNTSGAQ